MAIATLTKGEAAELQKLLDAYDKARDDLYTWIDLLQSEWSDAIDDKSEKWQESEPGQAAIERRDALLTFLDEIPESIPPIDIEELSHG